jgi:Family of unknown function (DUF5752)
MTFILTIGNKRKYGILIFSNGVVLITGFGSHCTFNCQNNFNICLHYHLEIVSLSMSIEMAQKILSPVPYEQGFHFFMPDGHYSGETAMSLCIFLKDLGRIDTQSIRFHFERGDFQKWLKAAIGDEELAQRIDKIDKTAPDEVLSQQLAEIVQKRISELQLIDT